MLAIYLLYGFYDNNPISLFNTPNILYDKEIQVSFLNRIVTNNNFPSKYDKRCKLLRFARECDSMSKFIEERKNKTCCKTDSIDTENTHGIHVHQSVSPLPNSIDKIIDTITKLLDSDANLDENDQSILNSIDEEIADILI